MVEKGWSHSINVTWAGGRIASPFKSTYLATKHRMVGLTKILALDAAEKSIACNAIYSAYIYTRLVKTQISEQAGAHGIPREEFIRDVLLTVQSNERFATVEELGDIALFLTSDAAPSITGMTISADGDLTAHGPRSAYPGWHFPFVAAKRLQHL